ERPLILGEFVDTPGSIVVAKVVEVSGDLKPGFVRDRAFASDIEPAVADDQPIEPVGEDLIGDGVIAPQPQREVARLRSAETSARPVDPTTRLPLEVFAVKIAEVGQPLAERC